MVAFEEPLPVDYDGAFVNGETIDWIARDASKPGRAPGERSESPPGRALDVSRVHRAAYGRRGDDGAVHRSHAAAGP